MLLEVLSVWRLSIPKLGVVKAQSIPFVVLTSNEERRIGETKKFPHLRVIKPGAPCDTVLLVLLDNATKGGARDMAGTVWCGLRLFARPGSKARAWED